MMNSSIGVQPEDYDHYLVEVIELARNKAEVYRAAYEQECKHREDVEKEH